MREIGVRCRGGQRRDGRTDRRRAEHAPPASEPCNPRMRERGERSVTQGGGPTSAGPRLESRGASAAGPTVCRRTTKLCDGWSKGQNSGKTQIHTPTKSQRVKQTPITVAAKHGALGQGPRENKLPPPRWKNFNPSRRRPKKRREAGSCAPRKSP